MADVLGGRILWKLDVDDKQFNAKMAAAQGSTGKFAKAADGHLGQVQGSTSRLAAVAGAFAKTAAVAVTAGIGAWGIASIKSAAAMQQNRIAFETMLGSGARAATMLKEIEAFALKTPFNLPQVVEGAKSLLAYGISAEKIIPTFNALGNIAAGVGKDKLPQLTLAFGQVRAAGRLTGMELRQFTEAGVPLLEVLGKQMGKSTAEIKEMVEAGKIGFPEVEKALFSMSEAGGRFENLMVRQSTTLSGSFTNFVDTLGKVGRALVGVSSTGEVRAGSLFATLAKGLSAITNFLVANEGAIIKFGVSMQEGLGTAIGYVVQGFKMLQPVLAAVGNFLVAIFQPAWAELTASIQQASPWLKNLAITIGGTLLLAIVAVAFAAGILIVGMIRMATVIVDVISSIFNSIVGAMSGIIITIMGTAQMIVSVWTWSWNTARGVVTASVAAIVGIVSTINRIVGIVSSAVSGVAAAIRGGFQAAYNAVASYVGQFFIVGRDIVMGVVRGILSAASLIGDTLRNLAKGALEAAKAAIGAQSPSRLFAEQVGKPIAQGIAVGISDNLHLVKSALSGISPSSVSGMAPGMSEYGTSGVGVTINAKQLSEADIDMGVNRAQWKIGNELKTIA